MANQFKSMATELTDEQKAAIAASQAKTAARVAELKTYEGKTFKLKGDTGPTTYRVLRYAGIGIKNGISAHTFEVERKNPGAIWTPAATQFLAEHEEITATETKPSQEVI